MKVKCVEKKAILKQVPLRNVHFLIFITMNIDALKVESTSFE